MAELAAQPVLSILETIPLARLGDAMGERIRVLSRFLRERGTPPAGPPYVRYHTFTDTDTDMEFGVPVTQPTSGDGTITGGRLPAGPAVTTWHLSAVFAPPPRDDNTTRTTGSARRTRALPPGAPKTAGKRRVRPGRSITGSTWP